MRYEFPCDPEEWDVRLSNADRALIHPAMLFLLRESEDVKKRAYLARYLEEVQIPEEIRVDPMVAELIVQHRELRELREQFEQTHNELEDLGATNVDELKATITEMESDKARLATATRIASYKRKMANVKNLEEMLKWTSKLRQESEREMNLAEQTQRLNDEKRLLMHREQVAGDRIKNMRAHLERSCRSRGSRKCSLRASTCRQSTDTCRLSMSTKRRVWNSRRNARS